jgi:hypothetical protein
MFSPSRRTGLRLRSPSATDRHPVQAAGQHGLAGGSGLRHGQQGIHERGDQLILAVTPSRNRKIKVLHHPRTKAAGVAAENRGIVGIEDPKERSLRMPAESQASKLGLGASEDLSVWAPAEPHEDLGSGGERGIVGVRHQPFSTEIEVLLE